MQGRQVFGEATQARVVEFAAGGGVAEAGMELGSDAAVVVEDLLVCAASFPELPGAEDLVLDQCGLCGGEVTGVSVGPAGEGFGVGEQFGCQHGCGLRA